MRFYITTAIPYVNAKPHMGHALEYTQGDVLARYHRQIGDNVFYISGADENSLKNVQAAEKEGITTQQLCDRNAQAFIDLAKAYNISLDAFARSSSPAHYASSQELWKRCEAAGDIYKKKYKGLYCVGCEQFYTLGELNEKGECFEHPGKKLDEVEEENYFFKLSNYQDKLLKLIQSGEYKIIPEHRKNEALGFIKLGLQDFSISRSKERAHGWGVPVPGDESQIMYVWFDALNVYRSVAIVSPKHGEGGSDWWPAALHIIGKGIIRFHAIYWPAMLLSAKLALPKELFVHGYITINGEKMSKSVGNVVDPMELVQTYGVDAIRYYLLREIPSDGDGDWSLEKFKARYNADLANGIGNFTARVLTMARKINLDFANAGTASKEIQKAITQMQEGVKESITRRKLHEALAAIWKLLSIGDSYINEKKPWEASVDPKVQKTVINDCLVILKDVAIELAPFLPETSKAILVGPTQALFPRL